MLEVLPKEMRAENKTLTSSSPPLSPLDFQLPPPHILLPITSDILKLHNLVSLPAWVCSKNPNFTDYYPAVDLETLLGCQPLNTLYIILLSCYITVSPPPLLAR